MQNEFSIIYSFLNACGGKPLSQISKFSKGTAVRIAKMSKKHYLRINSLNILPMIVVQ